MTLELALKLLDALGVVGPLAPDRLERLDHLLDRPVDGARPVAEQASFEADVSQFDGAVGHEAPPFSVQNRLKIASTTFISRNRQKIATTGERSSGPNDGSRRRNS